MFFKKSIALLLAILMVISFCVVVSADDGDETDDDYYYQSCGCDEPTAETFIGDYDEIIGSNRHGHIRGFFEVYQCCNCNGYITIITGNQPEEHAFYTPDPTQTTRVCSKCGYVE